MGDQEDLFEHLEGASVVDVPSEYSYSHTSNTTGSEAYGSVSSKRGANGGSRTTSSKDLDLDLDLDLASLNNLDLEDPSLDLHNGDARSAGVVAAAKKAKEGGNDSLGPPYAGGLLDDTYDMEVEPVEELPPHACAYCGIHNTACVVKCLVCNKW